MQVGAYTGRPSSWTPSPEQVRAAIRGSVGVGKRVLAAYRASRGAAESSSATAKRARKAFQAPKPKVQNSTTAGPAFNPGSTGGWKGKLKKKRRSKKKGKQARALRLFRKKVMAAVNFTKVSDYRQTFIFPIQTSAAYPVIPFAGPYNRTVAGLTTTGNCPKNVGYNLLEGPTFVEQRAELLTEEQTVKFEPWVLGSDEGRIKQYLTNPKADAQYTVKRSIRWQMEFRNNSTTSAHVVIYLMRCVQQTDSSALTELSGIRAQNYVNSNTPVALNTVEDITLDYQQYMKLKLCGKKRNWVVDQEFTMVLNGGDVVQQSLAYEQVLPMIQFETTAFEKGQYQLIARIMGPLAIDVNNPALYDRCGTVIGCQMNRHVLTYISKKDYDVVNRIGPTLAGAVATPGVAQDAGLAGINM